MSILATLRQSRAGEWKNLDEYLRELRQREDGALAALANALSASPDEQKELVAQGEGGAILLEVACDLRVPKSARLAASRALLEAGIAGPFVGHLFIGAGDLVTDPRLGAMARKLVESGLPSALQLGGESAQIKPAAGPCCGAAGGTHGGKGAVGGGEEARPAHPGAAVQGARRPGGGVPQPPSVQADGSRGRARRACAGTAPAPHRADGGGPSVARAVAD